MGSDYSGYWLALYLPWWRLRVTPKPKRKNQTDLTLRNLRALKKTAQSLEARVATLEQEVLRLTNQPPTPPPPPSVDDN